MAEMSLPQWGLKTKKALDELAREAVTDLAETANANAPIRTGKLRRSMSTAINDQPFEPGTAAIAKGRVGDEFWIGWLAPYAHIVEYGSRLMTPRQYAGRAIMQWRDIVGKTANRIRNRK